VARHADRLVGEEESLMTETLAGVSPSSSEGLLEQPSLAEAAVAGAADTEDVNEAEVLAEPSEAELAIARELVRSGRARGVAMTGPGGMLKALTKTVIETALDEEMCDHLGYDKHEPAGRGSGNSRNGSGRALEAGAQRVRDHLRRPDAQGREPLMRIAAYIVCRTDPKDPAATHFLTQFPARHRQGVSDR
jgi:Transposase, Mutator family